MILFRRLRQPLTFTGRVCRCGRLIDPNGHHRAACARSGVLGRRGFALESAVARICREAGGRVRTEDARRLEVVVDGLPLHGGAQLAVDTTLVSALHGDQGGAPLNEMAWHSWLKRKEQSHPEFLGARCRAWLVVLAVEVGGRFSRETSLNWRGPVPGARLRS